MGPQTAIHIMRGLSPKIGPDFGFGNYSYRRQNAEVMPKERPAVADVGYRRAQEARPFLPVHLQPPGTPLGAASF